MSFSFNRAVSPTKKAAVRQSARLMFSHINRNAGKASVMALLVCAALMLFSTNLVAQMKTNTTTNKVVSKGSFGGDINVADAPVGADVHTYGGNIHIRSASKFVKAKTYGGQIKLDSVDGSIKAITYGGSASAKMVGDPNLGERDVEITAYGGDVKLIVPEGLSMQVEIVIDHKKEYAGKYKIISSFDIQPVEKERGGLLWGKTKNYIYGTTRVGDGKNKIKLKAENGNVYLMKGN